WDTLTKAQYLEMFCFLSTYLLSSQGDRVAMAHSVEIRLPFLDHRLVEYAARIPSIWKVLGLSEKHILKKALAGVVPEEISERRKFPFRAPIAEALVHGDTAERTLSAISVKDAEMFDARKVLHLVERTKSRGAAGEIDSMALAWIVSTLSLHRLFVKDFPKFAAQPAMRFDVLVDKRIRHADTTKASARFAYKTEEGE
ncbi:MAG: hypothetical protein GF344_05805, partial [Chitinivibrionales bacterium]|nr:hypothetical protein [Chitinivibrionales bacterium]MBD3356480.1 hypothetical protein [Chitinivibrionales bacterium]